MKALYGTPLENVKIAVEFVAYGTGYAVTGLLKLEDDDSILFAAPTRFYPVYDDLGAMSAAVISDVNAWIESLPEVEE